jgi:hypothetical protein
MRTMVTAEARLRRIATSYCIVDSLAKRQCLLIGDEWVFTGDTATVLPLDIMDINSLHGPVRGLHQDNGMSSQIILGKLS